MHVLAWSPHGEVYKIAQGQRSPDYNHAASEGRSFGAGLPAYLVDLVGENRIGNRSQGAHGETKGHAEDGAEANTSTAEGGIH